MTSIPNRPDLNITPIKGGGDIREERCFSPHGYDFKRQTASSPAVHIPTEFLRRIPKTDLHVHLDGSMRLETLIELSKEQV